MSDYIHSGSNKMNKVEAYKNDNKLLLADKLGHAKVSSLKESNLLNTIATVAQHTTDINTLKSDINGVKGAYVYRGTVATASQLPLQNNAIGDVYNVEATGANWAWNGENWDELGNSIVFALKTDGEIEQKVGKDLEIPINLQDCGICWGTTRSGLNIYLSSTIERTVSFYDTNSQQNLTSFIYTNSTQSFHYQGSTTLLQIGDGYFRNDSSVQLTLYEAPLISLYFGNPKAKLFTIGAKREDEPLQGLVITSHQKTIDGKELILGKGYDLAETTTSINYIDPETNIKVIGTLQFGYQRYNDIDVTWDITLYGADALIPNYDQEQPEVSFHPVLKLTTSLSDNSSYISEVDLSSFDQLQDVITLDTNIGNLTNLTTSDKTNIVTAINEIITVLNQQSFVDLINDQSVAGIKTFSNGIVSNVTGNLTGNASTSTKLETARSLTTKLDSTTAVTFDGSVAQDAIPVTGVLAITNGGTGSSTKNFVDLSSDQTIAGIKTFSSSINGNSATSTKLKTARSLTTKLDSNISVTFDGSADQNAIPVTGILPIANGGTGSSTKNFVDLTTDQSISGAKSFAEGPYGTSNAISASTIDLSNGVVFTKTISSNTTFTITGVPTGKAATFNLILTNGGAYTITWPASVKWSNDTAPTLTTNGIDVLTFLTPDGGTTWYGTVALTNVGV